MLAGEEPYEWTAMGESYVKPGVEDVVFALMRFHSGLIAHMHLSWLDPHKERRFTVVGSKRMATFDDMEIERKLTVYDKGFDEDYSSYGEYIARSGDVFSPRVPNEEPLRPRVQALPRLHQGRRRAALRRGVGAAGRARARGASALAHGDIICREALSCSPRTARRASCSARASSCRTTWSSAGTWWCTRAPGSGPARGFRTAAWSGSRSRCAPARARLETRPAPRSSGRA